MFWSSVRITLVFMLIVAPLREVPMTINVITSEFLDDSLVGDLANAFGAHLTGLCAESIAPPLYDPLAGAAMVVFAGVYSIFAAVDGVALGIPVRRLAAAAVLAPGASDDNGADARALLAGVQAEGAVQRHRVRQVRAVHGGAVVIAHFSAFGLLVLFVVPVPVKPLNNPKGRPPSIFVPSSS